MTREETRLRGAREPSIHLERELVWGAVIYRIQSKSFEKKVVHTFGKGIK